MILKKSRWLLLKREENLKVEQRRQVMRSRTEPMKKIARPLRQHRELILKIISAPKSCSPVASWRA